MIGGFTGHFIGEAIYWVLDWRLTETLLEIKTLVFNDKTHIKPKEFPTVSVSPRVWNRGLLAPWFCLNYIKTSMTNNMPSSRFHPTNWVIPFLIFLSSFSSHVNAGIKSYYVMGWSDGAISATILASKRRSAGRNFHRGDHEVPLPIGKIGINSSEIVNA